MYFEFVFTWNVSVHHETKQYSIYYNKPPTALEYLVIYKKFPLMGKHKFGVGSFKAQMKKGNW